MAGIVLGHAVAAHEGRKAVQTQSYGAETRGGAAQAEVVVSDEKIDYPKVISADITITMSQESFERYAYGTRPGSVLFVDADLVTGGSDVSGGTIYRVPATKIAADEFKKTLGANMVMLGAVTAMTKIVKPESLKMSIREVTPGGSADLNTQALERGFDWATANLRKS